MVTNSQKGGAHKGGGPALLPAGPSPGALPAELAFPRRGSERNKEYGFGRAAEGKGKKTGSLRVGKFQHHVNKDNDVGSSPRSVVIDAPTDA